MHCGGVGSGQDRQRSSLCSHSGPSSQQPQRCARGPASAFYVIWQQLMLSSPSCCMMCPLGCCGIWLCHAPFDHTNQTVQAQGSNSCPDLIAATYMHVVPRQPLRLLCNALYFSSHAPTPENQLLMQAGLRTRGTSRQHQPACHLCNTADQRGHQAGCAELCAQRSRALSRAVQNILHTGDMRWKPSLADAPALQGLRIDLLFLDTTYASPKHTHPPQVCVHSSSIRASHAPCRRKVLAILSGLTCRLPISMHPGYASSKQCPS